MITFRPVGPMVTLTARASAATPFFISSRAASSNITCLVAMCVILYLKARAVCCACIAQSRARVAARPLPVAVLVVPRRDQRLPRLFLEPAPEVVIHVVLPVPGLAGAVEPVRAIVHKSRGRLRLLRLLLRLRRIDLQEAVHPQTLVLEIRQQVLVPH